MSEDRITTPREEGAGALHDPVVPPDVYDERYYRHTCMGAETWEASGGREFDGLYPAVLDLARLVPGETLVDVGTGRGELLVAALHRGAARAVGVEYSPAAVRLARQTLETHAAAPRARVELADARRLPLPDAGADLVTFIDVVEHLAATELDAALAEARRVLRPGGRILVHTMPSRTIYGVTYRLQRALHPGRRRRWPRDPRNDFERLMHVNEQTVSSLARALRRAGFRAVRVRPGRWVYTDFVPDEQARALYHRLARVPALSRLGIADMWGHGRR